MIPSDLTGIPLIYIKTDFSGHALEFRIIHNYHTPSTLWYYLDYDSGYDIITVSSNCTLSCYGLGGTGPLVKAA